MNVTLAIAKEKVRESAAPIGGWLQITLMVAGVYNILWGMWAIFFPASYFHLSGLPPLNQPEIWQCLGMVIGLYGLGYLIASTNIVRYWPLVFIGLLGKIFGPIGYLYSLFIGTMPISGVWLIFFNDLIWWIPFSLILLKVYEKSQKLGTLTREEEEALETLKGIVERSNESPQLVILLRHFGCTFAREMLKILESEREGIDRRGVQVTIVHMGIERKIKKFITEHNLDDISVVSDPSLTLYRAFGIEKASLWKTFGVESWVRGFNAGIIEGCGVGELQGDGYQLAGLVLLDEGELVKKYEYRNVSEYVSYEEFLNKDGLVFS